MRGYRVVILVGALVVSVGCTRTFKGKVVQPNPLADPNETLRQSEKITIETGDMELDQPDPAGDSTHPGNQTGSIAHNHRYLLLNQASFTIVSRDRLRFHVQIDHKWQEWADLNTWEVVLEDDAGRHWTPESVEHARTKIMTTMWDREQRTAVCSGAGRDGAGNCITVMGTLDDGWKRRQSLGALSVFRGKADFVFYQRDLFHANVHKLRLVLKRSGGVAFQFTWDFRDTVATE